MFPNPFDFATPDEARRMILSRKLREGEELTESDRQYLADLLFPPKKPASTNPKHRPKGSRTTENRNTDIMLDYDLVVRHGESDSRILELAEKYNISAAAVRKSLQEARRRWGVSLANPFKNRKRSNPSS